MADKTDKLKARLPRGLFDRSAAEIAATRVMIEKIRAVYERYGFDAVETPAIEYTDALGKFLPDQDRPNEGVFSFQDDDEQWLSLRYDLTAPLARYVAENFDMLPKPYRSYRVGWVFRNEKPGPGRFRQFMQFDADTVGSASPAADAELCMMAADTMEALGIPRGSYVVKVSNRKILEGLRQSLRITNDWQWLTALRAIDKLDRVDEDGVRSLLGKSRRDISGDVTKGADLEDHQIDRIMRFISRNIQLAPAENYSAEIVEQSFCVGGTTKLIAENNYTLSCWSKLIPNAGIGREGIEELGSLARIVSAGGYGTSRILLDPSVVRGLEYYTGTVFELDLNIATAGGDGSPRFGSVGGGGRYDGLVARFRGEPVPATGFSIGVSRLAAALEHIGELHTKPEPGPVVVTVFDQDRIADYQAMVGRLRAANIRAEVYLGGGKFAAQMKYADKRNAPCVVIQGSDEKAKSEVTIKDLIVGAELAKLEKGRGEHLQKQAQAQRAVPEDRLVEAVREVLARHGLASG
jgi:histidyl-tRNA synthetase